MQSYFRRARHGYSKDGRYYTDDSSYSDHGGHFTNIAKGHKLPGNTQDEVLVEGRLYVYLKTFEQFIAKQSGVEYVNLARTGVRIEGTTFMSYGMPPIGWGMDQMQISLKGWMNY